MIWKQEKKQENFLFFISAIFLPDRLISMVDIYLHLHVRTKFHRREQNVFYASEISLVISMQTCY